MWYHTAEIVKTLHILLLYLSTILCTADDCLEILITLVLAKENITNLTNKNLSKNKTYYPKRTNLWTLQ